MDKNFLTATGPPTSSWATLEPASEITPQVLAALPAPDVATDQATTWLKYNHRRLKDADLYFFFNEGDQPLSLKTTVQNSGTAKQAQQWDTTSGKIEPWARHIWAPHLPRRQNHAPARTPTLGHEDRPHLRRGRLFHH
jgi:hypothetical protein